MNRFAVVAAVIATLPGWLGGTALMATAGQDETRLEKLERDLLRIRQENKVAEVELSRLRQIISKLESDLATAQTHLEAAQEPTPCAEAPVSTQTPLEATRLRDGGNSIEEQDLTDEELGDSAEPQTAAAAPTTSANQAPVTSAEVDVNARNLYDDSYTLFHEKRYGEAEVGFRRFLELYPATDLSDNAQFWIGEARFAQGRYEEALQAFLLTVERFADGNKVPDAFYKAGRCLEISGDRERAITTYEETIRRFPSSAAAISAREHLEALR